MDLHAVREFARELPPRSRVLEADSSDGHYLQLFNSLGWETEGFATSAASAELASRLSGCRVWHSEPVLLRLERERYDGIWAYHTLNRLPAVGCQRMLATFFSGLKAQGRLFISIRAGSQRETPIRDGELYLYHPEDLASLIRQSGFQILTQGISGQQVAFIAKRVSGQREA